MSINPCFPMLNRFRALVVLLVLMAALVLGSCSNYKYYNRYPKPRKCNCPSFTHTQNLNRPTLLT